jgi:hypothetical protein
MRKYPKSGKPQTGGAVLVLFEHLAEAELLKISRPAVVLLRDLINRQ